MSDLNLGPAQSSSPTKAILLAVIVLALVAGAVYYLNPRKTAELSVPRVQLYAAQTAFKAEDSNSGMHVIGQSAHVENDLYVVATLHIDDKLRLPLFLTTVTATYTSPKDETLDTTSPSAADLARIQESFPALTPMMPQPLDGQTQIAPGASAEGTVLLHFPGLTEADWKARKSAIITVNLAHQAPQTVTIP
jgi:hypothetical protein